MKKSKQMMAKILAGVLAALMIFSVVVVSIMYILAA